MSKKLWDWCYLKQPVDYMGILRSENIDKGRKVHEAIHKRMKELIGSGPPLKFVGPTEPICFMHCADADNVFAIISDDKKECDCELKILKNRNSKNHEKILSWSPKQNSLFNEIVNATRAKLQTDGYAVPQENKPNQNGDIMPTIKTTVESAKLQMNGRQLRTEKLSKNEQLNEKYDFVNFSWVSDPIDPRTKIKSCNPQGEQILDPHDVLTKQEEQIIPSFKRNKSSQVSICSSCNYYNEWIPFDPDYKCYKCKKGL